MKKTFTLFAISMSVSASAQVGIGTTTPQAGLHVADSSVVFTAPGLPDNTPIRISNGGRSMIWHAGKAAFRAGYAVGNQWDDNNIGLYSVAMGNGTTATGEASVALGTNAIASADRAMAFNGTASAVGAIALGSYAQATGDDALALGPSSIAGGLASIVLGPSVANGAFGVAIGLQNSASGNFSTAMGKNARTENRQGSFVIGDGSAGFSSEFVSPTANNQMAMRFVGGYKFYTGAGATGPSTPGVELAPGGGAWSAMSDVNKKENFVELDNEEILIKVAGLQLSRWNYKSQPASQQHIGPMAQDFHAAFGLDGESTTTINSVDADGINMAAIQALEKRTTSLKKENESLKEKVDGLTERIARLEQLLNAKSAN